MTDPALAAAIAALAQQVTGLGTAVTLLATKQNAGGPAGSGRRGGVGPDGVGDADLKPPGEGSEGGPLGKAVGFAAAKVMMFIAPIVAVSNVLSQTVSGLGVFTAAIKVLGATIAPLVLPIFVLLAAAIVAVSDELWDLVKSVLPAWYGYIMTTAIPVFVALVASVRGVIDWLDRWRGNDRLAGRRDGDPTRTSPRTNQGHREGDPSFGPPVPGMTADRVRVEWRVLTEDVVKKQMALMQTEHAHSQGKATDQQLEHARRAAEAAADRRRRYLEGFEGSPDEVKRHLDEGNVPRIRGADQPPPGLPPQPGRPPRPSADALGAGLGPAAVGAPGGPAGRPTALDRMRVATQDVVTSLRMSLAPPPAIISNVNRKVQEDALKTDPLERRVQERSLTAIDIVEELLPKIFAELAQRPGLFGGR